MDFEPASVNWVGLIFTAELTYTCSIVTAAKGVKTSMVGFLKKRIRMYSKANNISEVSGRSE